MSSNLIISIAMLIWHSTLKTKYKEEKSQRRTERKQEYARGKKETNAIHKGQAKKSKGRMPWRQEPKKDAVSCEKPRGDAHSLRTVGIRMGKPGWEKPSHP